MIVSLDSVRIAADEAGPAARGWAFLTGRQGEGGRGGTRFQLDQAALEIFVDAGGEGPRELVFATADVEATRAELAARGLATRDAGRDGLVRLDPAATHGVAMALAPLDEPFPAPPAAGGVTDLDHVVIRTGDPERAIGLYRDGLGLDLRLDRTAPEWGARMLFFRCGRSILEVVAPLEGADPAAPDRLDGLALRVADPNLARARLAGGGLDVSEVRAGRKPGTAVFTVREGVVGAPALIIGPASAAP